MKKICIFTQTYSNNRKILYNYHDLDDQDIIFRNNFDNLYAFHNCSKQYIDEIKNTNYLKNIKNIKYIEYNDTEEEIKTKIYFSNTYTKTFKKTLKLISVLGYDYIAFIQDDCFTELHPNLDKLIKFIKEEDFMMLNLENILNIDKKILYQNQDFIIYDTSSIDFSNSIDTSHTFNPRTDKPYWCFDDGPYIANLEYVKKHIYDDNYFNSNDMSDGEYYLMNKIYHIPIQRLTMNNFLYRRRNIIGQNTENKENEEKYLNDRFYINTRIKCINLERRKDRLNYMKKILSDYKLINFCDFFKAVDGKELKPTEELIKLFSGNDFENRRSFIGCTMSHYTLMQNLLKDNNYENYLILEDDIQFKDKMFYINNVFKSLENIDWDIVYLGYHIKSWCIDSYNSTYKNQKELIVIPHLTDITIGGLFGYLINKSGAKKIIDFIQKNGMKHGIDYIIFSYHKEMNLNDYETVPRLITSKFVPEGVSSSRATSGEIDSDIQYDYTSLF